MRSDMMDYIKTGAKLLLLNIILALIYTPINLLFVALFGASLMASILAGTGFTLILAIVLAILWLAISLLVGGWLAQKIWKWD